MRDYTFHAKVDVSMSTKTRAGLAGAIAVVVILFFQAIEHWTVVDSVLAGLRSEGPSGKFMVDILTSRLLPLVMAITAIILVLEGRKEKNEPLTLPPASLPAVPAPAQSESNPSQSMNQTGVKVETHFHGGVPAPAPSPRPPIRKEPEPTPNIRCLGPTHLKLRLGMDGLGFYETYGEHQSAVVCFRNETSVQKKVAAVKNVRASISFFAKAGDEMGTGIAEACWLGDFRSIDFIVEQSHCMIAVAVINGKIVSPYIRRIPSRWGDHCVTDFYEFDESPARIEIRLIKGSDLLLPPNVFDCSVEGGKPLLKVRP
jgi:hypothetical protein